jgi:hypothetical protein
MSLACCGWKAVSAAAIRLSPALSPLFAVLLRIAAPALLHGSSSSTTPNWSAITDNWRMHKACEQKIETSSRSSCRQARTGQAKTNMGQVNGYGSALSFNMKKSRSGQCFNAGISRQSTICTPGV